MNISSAGGSGAGIMVTGLVLRVWRAALPAALLALLLLAACFVIHRYVICNDPACFHSDDLYGVDVSQDILGRGYERSNWHFPYAPQLFPEQLLLVPCVALFKDLAQIFLGYQLLYHMLSALVLTALLRQTGLGRREAFLFGAGGQLFLLTALLEPTSLSWIQIFASPSCHTGAILVGLFLWLQVVRNLHRPVPWLSAVLFVGVGSLAVFSDRIVVAQFIGPMCLAVVGLTLFRAVPLRKGLETIVLGGATYGGALGIQSLCSRWNIHVTSVGVLTDFSKTAGAIQGLWVNVPPYFEGQYLIIITVFLLLLIAPVIGLYHTFQARRQRLVDPAPTWCFRARTGAIAMAAWCCCFCTVGALVVSGIGRFPGPQRYLLGLFFVPFLFLPVCLRWLPGRAVPLLARAIPLLVVLFAAYQMGGRKSNLPNFAFRDLRQPYPEICQVLDQLAHEGKIHRGLASYWLSRRNQYLCREPISIKAVLPDGEPILYVHNPNRFLTPGKRCLEMPRYDFILNSPYGEPFPKDEMFRLFGSPREQIQCGRFEIWLYDSLISNQFTLFLRSMLANRCRTQQQPTGPAHPQRLSRPMQNFTTKESGGRINLQPDGAATVTFASPVRGTLVDFAADYNGHFYLTFYQENEALGTVYVPRANFCNVSRPIGTPGIQSRLVTVPPAARQRGWTAATIRAAGGDGDFILSHFLVYNEVNGIKTRQLVPGGRWRFESELQPSYVPMESVVLDPLASEGKARFAPANFTGAPVVGPRLFLEPGRYRLEYFIKAGPITEPGPACTIDVASECGRTIQAQRQLGPAEFAGREGGYQKFTLEFESDVDLGECEFRVTTYGRAALYIDRIELVCLR